MGNKRRPLSTSHHKTLSAHQLVVTYTSVSTNAALYVHQTKHVKDAESGLIFFIIKHVGQTCRRKLPRTDLFFDDKQFREH